MAEKNQSSTTALTNTFNKGMIKDFNESFVGEGMWTHARNAVNNSHDGQLGVLGNEPANLKSIQFPYIFNGAIPIGTNEWAIFSTDDVNCEIGTYNAQDDLYTTVVNDPGLGLKTTHLITGVSRSLFNCGKQIYWDNGLTPTYTMDIENPPFKVKKVKRGDCFIDEPTTELDIERLRLAPLVDPLTLSVTKGRGAGTLLNGSYQVTGAYTIDSIKVTDYFLPSVVQPLWSHENSGGALEISIDTSDSNFDEFELVIISTVNQQTTAKRLGIYSTRQDKIYIDSISPELISVPISSISQVTPAFEKSDALYAVNNYLIRTGVYTKTDFNYQPLANKIQAKWVAVEYPQDYYTKGGNQTTYMRDEQYPFYIRWVYNTGDKSASYHIPGRSATGRDKVRVSGPDAFREPGQDILYKWQVDNTAKLTASLSTPVADGGVIVAEGEMGYWESTEKYPDNQPQIWGKLCGTPIRHHKFPDNTVSDRVNHVSANGNIVLLGVKFENIAHPLDIDGNPIPSIIGYEILRGSREGNKTIIAKGLFNNMREYSVPESTTVKGLYQNYPYNDLRADKFHSSSKSIIDKGTSGHNQGNPLTGYRKDIFSFHSPDTSFSRPYLAGGEVKIYAEVNGNATGYFKTPYQHPRFKQMADSVAWVGLVIGAITAVSAVSRKVNIEATEKFPIGIPLEVGPLPTYKAPAGGDVTGAAATIGAIALYAGELALWTANTVAVAAVATQMAALQREKIVELFKTLVPRVQYALQYNSHGYYNTFVSNNRAGNKRRKIEDLSYVGSSLQGFGSEYRINNLHRGNFVAIRLNSDVEDPGVQDTSRNRFGESGVEINQSFIRPISGLYGAIKINLSAQYGQLDAVKQLPVSNVVFKTFADSKATFSTDVLFGGDVYINRYTEKNPFLFFTDYLMGQPDEFEYNYRNYVNIPYPRYWIDNVDGNYGVAENPSRFRHLESKTSGVFHLTRGYFYLFCNGVRDFFVESEVNLALRDYDEEPSKQHYDINRYTDIDSMFRSDVIKSNNFYKYDYSLSAGKLYNNFFSWGTLLSRSFDPLTAATCFSYYPERAIYSLPQRTELRKDNWKVFLANNYRDFSSKISSIYSINRNGALILLNESSPVQFMGSDQLQTDAGTKLTIGDGGLFEQPLQNIVNADRSLQYGGNQNRYGVISTPNGVFWISQNQGRIFNYAGNIDEITNSGMKYWFRKYLPSQLLLAFPDFELPDNPVKGVSAMLSYDNTNMVLYVSKRDFIVKDNYQGRITYLNGTTFLLNGRTKIDLSNEQYFEDISFTVSYDIKNKSWISFHDWHPDFTFSGPDYIMTVKERSLYKHGIRCDKYCNFYGVDYPFEVEFVATTGQSISTIKSVEYILEAYKYFNNCRDKHHVLDENFDRAVVYNSEQISGMLNLNLKPKNNPVALLNYPKVNSSSIDIHYSKEENKYRFNQFFDITRNRNEFDGIKKAMFNTSANGYVSDINPNNINYSKDPLQHKKFRHYATRVWLKKKVSGEIKMLFKLNNTKLQLSTR